MTQANKQELIVQDNMVVTIQYKLKTGDEVIEETGSDDAVQFIQGIGQLIPGLEKELYGMRVGESKDVHVAPEEGYGLYIEEGEPFAEIPISEFPADDPIEPGLPVLLQDDEGDEQEAYITGSLNQPHRWYPFSDVDVAVGGCSPHILSIMKELEDATGKVVDVIDLDQHPSPDWVRQRSVEVYGREGD